MITNMTSPKRQCYRALIMRVTEVYVEVWADSYEEAVASALMDEDLMEVETRIHDDQLLDVKPYEPEFAC